MSAGSRVCFRLLSEYRFFLFEKLKALLRDKNFEFPSPFRVSFLLIISSIFIYSIYSFTFPSPFRVSFLLIRTKLVQQLIKAECFRLLSEYRFFLSCLNISLLCLRHIVSVSFQSIVSSYIWYSLYLVGAK